MSDPLTSDLRLPLAIDLYCGLGGWTKSKRPFSTRDFRASMSLSPLRG